MEVRIEDRIEALVQLGYAILDYGPWIDNLCEAAYIQNKWFTKTNSLRSLNAIANQFLNTSKLKDWMAKYKISNVDRKKVGLVLAGNIPLVGWHDILCTFVAGHTSIIKYSSKDEILTQGLIQRLEKINPETKSYFQKEERIKNVDAVIATGGNTAATHFKHYFDKQPHIIRKNRSSIAILSGEESMDELYSLMDDIFVYFGLGCRSVSKVYIPVGFSTDAIFEASLVHADVIDHTKYKNNFDYNNAIYLLGQRPFLTNNFLILTEDEALSSRISCLHFEKYESLEELIPKVNSQSEELQCVSSSMDIKGVTTTPLGQCQLPGLSDYADGIDTLQFLIEL